MNQVLAATIIVITLVGTGIIIQNQISTSTVGSTVSSNIDSQKQQEEIFAEYDGNDITVINRGKETSEIIKYRFYDDNEQLIKEISSGGGLINYPSPTVHLMYDHL